MDRRDALSLALCWAPSALLVISLGIIGARRFYNVPECDDLDFPSTAEILVWSGAILVWLAWLLASPACIFIARSKEGRAWSSFGVVVNFLSFLWYPSLLLMVPAPPVS